MMGNEIHQPGLESVKSLNLKMLSLVVHNYVIIVCSLFLLLLLFTTDCSVCCLVQINSSSKAGLLFHFLFIMYHSD